MQRLKQNAGHRRNPYTFLILVPLLASLLNLEADSYAWDAGIIILSMAVLVGITVYDGLLIWKQHPVVGRFILEIGVLYWFWIEALAKSVQSLPFSNSYGRYTAIGIQLPSSLVAETIFYVNLFAATAFMGWALVPVPKKLIRRLSVRLDPRIGTQGDIVLFLMACLFWLPIFVSFRGNVLTAVKFMMAMRSAGPEPTVGVGLLLHFQWIGLFAGAASLTRLLTGARGSRVLQVAAIAVLLPGAFLGSSRYTLAYVLLPACIVLVNAQGVRPEVAARQKIRALVLVGTTAVLLLIQGAIRSHGGMAGYVEGDLGQQSLVGYGVERGFVGNDQFSAAAIAIDITDRRGSPFYESVLPFFITHFIPRQIWPNKPVSRSWTYYDTQVTNGGRYNVTPSIIGQFYLNWGGAGVVLAGLLLAWVARIGNLWWGLLDMKKQLVGASLCGLWFAFVFMSFRLFWPLYFQYPVFGFLVYVLLCRKPAPRIRLSPAPPLGGRSF